MINQLEIFKSLFKGRDDVFAIRWDKEGKGGYMPVYDLNWQDYAKHKTKGGILNNFPDKRYLPLTDDRLKRHLLGTETLGIYPLLPNNTSWFITADFDEGGSKNKKWFEECQQFIFECKKYDLPIYLERSRSGKGGHVWMFFEEAYAAQKSRYIFRTLLTNAGIITTSDNKSNFDRLFPNQDYHSGKGLGNLIALPLQKKALESNNTAFIDPANLEPFTDQWLFLQTIQRISIQKLDEVFHELSNANQPNLVRVSPIQSIDGKLSITLSNQIFISSIQIDPAVRQFLRENLNFMNIDFFIKRKTGKNTYNIDRQYESLTEENDHVKLPRGFIGKLLRFCKEKEIAYELIDERQKLESIEFKSDISLYDYQKTTVEITDKKDFGVIVAPPGTGKTVMGLSIIARKQQPALIIVHRKQLMDQWVERIQSFLGLAKFQIGKIASGKCEIGNEVTVAMIQSLTDDLLTTIHQSFGIILIDECHHIPAKTFSSVIQKFSSYYMYGFTATPFRKNGDERLIFINIGEIIHKVDIPLNNQNANQQVSVIVRETNLFAPFNSKTDNIETLNNILIHDTARNELIERDIRKEVLAGRKVLVLTERKAHTNILNQYFKSSFETIVITGEDAVEARKSKLRQIEDGNFQILITTGQFMGEGADIQALDCLVLVYPFSFEGKLIQYIGRVQRNVVKPIIYDYRDSKIEYLDNLFKQRNRYYRKLVTSGQINQYKEMVLSFDELRFYISSTENYFPIHCLDLPIPVDAFLPGLSWLVRIINYNDNDGQMLCEIIDYNYQGQRLADVRGNFYFLGIEKIKFRSIDTAAFLRSVVLKKLVSEKQGKVRLSPAQPEEFAIIKTMKVPFWKIRFLYGAISFPVYIEELNEELFFEIANADIRPEFEAIKEYFIKMLKKKVLIVDIAVRYTSDKIISATAKSDDIDSINSKIIEGIRFEFVKKKFFKPVDDSLLDKVNTLGELAQEYQAFFNNPNSEKDLIADILNIKHTKHFLQLQYLSSKHEASVLKLRFVLQPFSFIFLLAGQTKYHIVWETLNTEEATYIWHTEKSRDSLRLTLNSVETLIIEIRRNGRMDYLKQDRENFSRILHEYTDSMKGFILWKGLLEERIS